MSASGCPRAIRFRRVASVPCTPRRSSIELRVRLFERAQREVAEVLERQPAGQRPLPPGEHERDTGGQRRHEHLAQPRVHEPEQLVVVQREDDRRRERREMLDELAEVVEVAGGVKEAALGRLDDAAVQLDDAGPGCSRAVEEGAEERGLADAGDPVDADDLRFAVQAFRQRSELDLASYEGPSSRREGRRHMLSMDRLRPVRGKHSRLPISSHSQLLTRANRCPGTWPTPARFSEPSTGLEPATPSLPRKCSTNWAESE